MAPGKTELATLQKLVWDYYHAHGRSLPWRTPEPDGNFDPYKILVSEIMLQQTQVSRVIPKYQTFLMHFPSLDTISGASLADVLRAWSGLGYNRRAKYLHQAAQRLVDMETPWKYKELVQLPGIGPNTAAAIMVYAYNRPYVFVETNIRTVYIHHFFPGQTKVSDEDILELVKLTLPSREEQPDEAIYSLPGAMRNPRCEVSHCRIWFWALMDYGSYLKSTVGNVSRASATYTKQPTFTGSQRQIRGQVIRLLTHKAYSSDDLVAAITDTRLDYVLKTLVREGLVIQEKSIYRLA